VSAVDRLVVEKLKCEQTVKEEAMEDAEFTAGFG